jgi:hypothetical protein
MKIKAKTVYLDTEGGFWGLETKKSQYLPINYPEQLKTSGIMTECNIELMPDVESQYSWGMVCRLISFKTLTPYN